MPLLTRWLPASAAPYMEVALALPDIGRWYVFFLNSYSRLEWWLGVSTRRNAVVGTSVFFVCGNPFSLVEILSPFEFAIALLEPALLRV